MEHIDEGTIHGWLEGALSEIETRRVESHVATCETCAERVAEARGLIAGASRILTTLDDVPGAVAPIRGDDESRPMDQLAALRMRKSTQNLTSRRRRFRTATLAAAAMVLVIAGSLVVRQSPSSSQMLAKRLQSEDSMSSAPVSVKPADNQLRASAPTASPALADTRNLERKKKESGALTTLGTATDKLASANVAPSAPSVTAPDELTERRDATRGEPAPAPAPPSNRPAQGAQAAAENRQQGQSVLQAQKQTADRQAESDAKARALDARAPLALREMRAAPSRSATAASFVGCFELQEGTSPVVPKRFALDSLVVETHGDSVWYRARALDGSSVAQMAWRQVNSSDSLGAQLLTPVLIRDANGRVATVRLVVGGLALTKDLAGAPAPTSATRAALLTARPFACR